MNANLPPLPAAWLCEFLREDGATDTQVVMDNPEGTRWADMPDGDGVSPYSVTPLYTAEQLQIATRNAALEEAAAAIPTNWTNPLLTGADAAVGKPPFGCPDIERLLSALQSAILALKDKP